MKRVYTKTGDKGTTGIHGGARVPKDDIRIEANGCLDELNAVIGIVRSMLAAEDGWQELLHAVQRELMVVMSHVATPSGVVNPNPLSAAELTLRCEQEMLTFGGHHNLKNVKISYDLVLNNKSVDLNSVYKNIPMSCDFNVKTNSIAIIPNVRNSVVCSEKILLEAYKSLIDRFIVYGKNVYILRHSNSDIDICDKIFKMFHNNNVFLIEQELSCVEFSNIVNKFDFVVASRFHSVVHSYKNAVPCLTMGWAVKYLDLHKLFHQEKYCFDVRNNFDISKLLSAAEDLLNNHSNQSEIISKELNQVQKHNIFDDINLEN